MLGNLRPFARTSPAPRRAPRRGAFRLDGSSRDAGPGTRGSHSGVEPGPAGSTDSQRRRCSRATVDQYLQLFPVLRRHRPRPRAGRWADRTNGGRFSIVSSFSSARTLSMICETYRRTLRQRNAALSPAPPTPRWTAWEAPLAPPRPRLVGRRRSDARVLAELFRRGLSSARGADSPEVALEYRGDPWCEAEDDVGKGGRILPNSGIMRRGRGTARRGSPWTVRTAMI